MTPVPKNLSKSQQQNWRRKVAAGWNPRVAALRVKQGYKNRDNTPGTVREF